VFKHWLARLFVLFGLIAATIYYWPQLRELANIANTARSINNTTELQIALAREGFSPGSIDGTNGSQTKRALLAYQTAHKLPLTGIFDVTTAHDLKIQEPVFITRELTRADFSDVGNKPPNWQALGALDKLRFYSLREMIAEQSQSDPDLIDSLNPDTNWHDLSIGDTIFIPYVPPFRVNETAAYLQIKLSERALQAFSADHRLLFHCPVSIARRIEKRPSGELRVNVRVNEPNYTFNPSLSAIGRSPIKTHAKRDRDENLFDVRSECDWRWGIRRMIAQR